ncbi:MAG: hypothetical protein HYY29_03815 [Chloroflexi bacterium]|nr:hypothetical protein [Chloroflexota bacterium]
MKYPIEWASKKQRRWYFWYRYQMEHGRTQARGIRLGKTVRMRKSSSFIPYRRGADQTSQHLGGGWRVDSRGQNAVVRNPVRYAAYVQGRAAQQPFHRNTGWTNTQQGIEKLMRSKQIKDIFRKELKMALTGLIR